MNWRDYVDLDLKDYLEMQIIESSKQKHAYKKSKNPSNAQLWCAIANLSKQIFNLNLKINYLEKKLQETLEKKSTKKAKKLKKSIKKL
jgi:hypothetical protein